MPRKSPQYLLQEIWKDIPGFESRFKVSNHGRIKSIDRLVNSVHGPKSKRVKGCIRVIGYDRAGYANINLEEKTYSLHRIVGKVFIPNPENKPEINHKDGNKANNHVSNLEWVSVSENKKHRYRVLKQPPSRSMLGKTGLLMHNSKPVAELCESGRIQRVFECATAAAKAIGTTQSRISCNARGESKTCHGRKFIYISRKQYAKYSMP